MGQGCRWWRRRERGKRPEREEEKREEGSREDENDGGRGRMREYTFAELKGATKNFRADGLVGHGGFGRVYRGVVEEEGKVVAVAVKRMKEESRQGMKEWEREVELMGKRFPLRCHPNLVTLLGYCKEGDELLLVYEFMAKGSLENHLFGRGALIKPLSWVTRLSIMIDAANALSFLHSSCIPVIYRDFKASNIMLDSDYVGKLSDFGLARSGPGKEYTHVTASRVIGTTVFGEPEEGQGYNGPTLGERVPFEICARCRKACTAVPSVGPENEALHGLCASHIERDKKEHKPQHM